MIIFPYFEDTAIQTFLLFQMSIILYEQNKKAVWDNKNNLAMGIHKIDL